MTRSVWTDCLFASLLLANAGCATITTGTTQAVALETDPPGAECSLTRERTVLGTVTTPGTLTIKRGGQPLTVECKKDGYEDGRTIMNAQTEKATYGNAILGGVIGTMIDQSSGANSRYEASVKLELTAMSEADRNYLERRRTQAVAVPTTASPPARGATAASLSGTAGGAPSTPTEIECVGTGGTRLRVTATACPAPLTRAQ